LGLSVVMPAQSKGGDRSVLAQNQGDDGNHKICNVIFSVCGNLCCVSRGLASPGLRSVRKLRWLR